jgi:hypothetical protein
MPSRNHPDPEVGELSPAEKAYRDAVIPPLLMRAYHLPGNNWKQDWVQYMTNNHPFLGIFCHHKYHPVTRTVRIFSLIGSILFGLALTNIIYLAFVFSDTDYDKTYIAVPANMTDSLTGQENVDALLDQEVKALSVTNGSIALWTIGAFLHATYDNVIWALAACTCCTAKSSDSTTTEEQRLKRYRGTGTLLVIFSVIVVTALATFAVALRSALDSGDVTAEQVETNGVTDANVNLWQVNGTNDLEFLLAFLVELVLSFFVYYPICGTILFSGILTCGKYPTTGGRPYELKEEARKAASGEGLEVVWNSQTKAGTPEQPRNSKPGVIRK